MSGSVPIKATSVVKPVENNNKNQFGIGVLGASDYRDPNYPPSLPTVPGPCFSGGGSANIKEK